MRTPELLRKFLNNTLGAATAVLAALVLVNRTETGSIWSSCGPRSEYREANTIWIAPSRGARSLL
jgi:hypothetical protein